MNPAPVVLILTVSAMMSFAAPIQAGERSASPNSTPAPSQNNQTQELVQKLRVRLSKFEKRKELVAVASVRGAKKGTQSSELYWKKTARQAPPTEKELEAFKGAVKTLEEGKKNEAASAFESFLAAYPKSRLAPDASSTLEALKGAPPETPPQP